MEELDEILEPIEIDVEKYSEDDYRNMLDEIYGGCDVCDYKMQSSYVSREMDPIAYNCGFSDFREYETKYECPICNAEYNDYEDAKWCCQVEPNELEEDE